MKNISKIIDSIMSFDDDTLEKFQLNISIGSTYAFKVAENIASKKRKENHDSFFKIDFEPFSSDSSQNKRTSSGACFFNQLTFRRVRVTENLTNGDIRVYFGDASSISSPSFKPIDIEPIDYNPEEKDSIDKIADTILEYLYKEDYSSVDKYHNFIKQKKANIMCDSELKEQAELLNNEKEKLVATLKNQGYEKVNSLEEFKVKYPPTKWGEYRPQPQTEPSSYPCMIREEMIVDNPNGADTAIISVVFI